MKRIKIIIATCCVCAVVMVGSYFGINYFNQDFYMGKPVTYTQTVQAFDTSTPAKAIGTSEYVFVARIDKILRTEYKNEMEIEVGLNEYATVSDPYTIYQITVIENIKGNMITNEPIEYMQYGGLNKDGKSYNFFEGCSLFNVGEYYVLISSPFENNGINEGSVSDFVIPLGKELNAGALKIINEYSQAYKNQVIPEAIASKSYPTKISKYDASVYKSDVAIAK